MLVAGRSWDAAAADDMSSRGHTHAHIHAPRAHAQSPQNHPPWKIEFIDELRKLKRDYKDFSPDERAEHEARLGLDHQQVSNLWHNR